jgi:hypothetical protein
MDVPVFMATRLRGLCDSPRLPSIIGIFDGKVSCLSYSGCFAGQKRTFRSISGLPLPAFHLLKAHESETAL